MRLLRRRSERAALGFACCALVLAPAIAHAEPDRTAAVGAAVHLLAVNSDACTQDGDVVGCSAAPKPFAGGDLNGYYWPIPLLGLGARLALSKDLDGTEGADSDGARWDPIDELLWRLSASARLDPPLGLGLWIAADLGVAVLNESQELKTDSGSLATDSLTRSAPLLGLALGWDFWLGDVLTLTPEARAQWIGLGDAVELRPGVEAQNYGGSLWIELALRFGIVL